MMSEYSHAKTSGQNFKRPAHFSRFISQGCTPTIISTLNTMLVHAPFHPSGLAKQKIKKIKKHSLKCYTYFHCLPLSFISHTALELSFKNVHQIFSFFVQNPSMVPIKLYGIVYNALKHGFSP